MAKLWHTLKVLRMGTTLFLLSNPPKLAPLIVTFANTNIRQPSYQISPAHQSRVEQLPPKMEGREQESAGSRQTDKRMHACRSSNPQFVGISWYTSRMSAKVASEVLEQRTHTEGVRKGGGGSTRLANPQVCRCAHSFSIRLSLESSNLYSYRIMHWECLQIYQPC